MRDDWRDAAIGGDSRAIQRLLTEGVDIDCRDRFGQTALMLAALHGRDEAVCVLLESGVEKDVIPTAQNSDSQGIPFLGWM